MTKLILTADVTTRKSVGKVKIVTDVTIRLNGKQAIAFETLGGRYTAEDAVKEFRNDPERFDPEGGLTQKDLMLYAMCG